MLIMVSTIGLAQTKPASPNTDDHVVIRPRTVTLVRSPALVKDFPGKKTAKVTYPILTGLSNVKVLRRVQALLQLKNIFDYSLEEYRQDTWLSEFGYEVNFNRNHILDLTFSQDGSGAYPDLQTKHIAINLKDGTIIKAADVFAIEKFSTLAGLINAKLQEELKTIQQELRDSKSDQEDIRISKEAQEQLEFKAENLDEFSIGAKGITFLYDAGYPHAIQAFEPVGKYFFSYRELKPFIKREGLLGQFVD